MTDSRWLLEFAALAEKTDRFAGKSDHAALLAAGLIGEAGSVVAELKKARREREAYPIRQRHTRSGPRRGQAHGRSARRCG